MRPSIQGVCANTRLLILEGLLQLPRLQGLPMAFGALDRGHKEVGQQKSQSETPFDLHIYVPGRGLRVGLRLI